jgi:dolichol-phosphate mannosyltransferase
MVRFVIPAFNEADNVPRLMAGLVPRARELGARLFVVDDGSSDGTAEAFMAHREDVPVTVTTHRHNRGLGVALNTGLRTALRDADDDDPIVTMEADTTSDLGDLAVMLARFEEGYDLVLASVYMPGGELIGVSRRRILMSRAVSDTFRVVGGLRHIHTLSSLYRVYRAGPLRRAADTYGYLLVREPGFAACVELLLKLHNAGASVCEIPTVNDWSARRGHSKMRLRPTALAYARVAAAQIVGRIQPPPMSPLAGEE